MEIALDMLRPSEDILFGEYPIDGMSSVFLQHLKAKEIKQLKPELFSEYFTFAFVRNPYDRAVSAWLWYQIAHSSEMDFKTFLTTEHIGNHNHPQIEFLTEDGRIIVDRIFRYENLTKAWKEICDTLGVRIKLPLANVIKKRQHYSVYYDNETRAIVEEMFGKDIALLDYKFEDKSCQH